MPLDKAANRERMRKQRQFDYQQRWKAKRVAEQGELDAAKALDTCDWIERLRIPSGYPHAGERMRLAEFQRKYIMNAMMPHIREAALIVPRKNGKSATIAAILLSYLCGPNHESGIKILCASLTIEHILVIQKFMRRYVEANNLPIEYIKSPRPGSLEGPQDATCQFLSGSSTSAAISEGAKIVAIDELGMFPAEKAELVEHLRTCTSLFDDSKLFAISYRGSSPILETLINDG